MLTRQPTCVIVYISISAVFSILLFLQGFFPMKSPIGKSAVEDDLPQSIAGTSVNVTSFYPQHIGRVVIMVIDALRWDFVEGVEGHQNMPYTSSVIEKHEACFLPMKAAPPTVTMPRIKALATGTIPNFIDVVMNLGSGKVSEDSFLKQAKEHGRKSIFFGDDTWLKMFPDMFIRSDGTTSFFVSDFTEVDNNVTRHLDVELTSTDWDIMVLHYLGLDHIGHLEGPRSPLVKPKLNEMDAIVQRIHNMLKEWDKTSDFPSLLIICGDHGMKNSGGHGGADLEEIMIPLIVISQICRENAGRNIHAEYFQRDRVLQIDVAPTMAVLMGLPIPSSSLGKIIPEIIKNLDVSQQLYALHYNSKQLSDQFEVQHKYTSSESLLEMQQAEHLHVQFLNNTASHSGQESEIARLYVSALDKMSTELAESLITFDLSCLFVAAILLWQLAIALLQDVQYSRMNGIVIFFGTVLVFSAERIYCVLSSSTSLLCSSISLPFLMALIFVININLMGQISFFQLIKTTKIFRDDQVSLTFVIGTLLHTISLISSSFIEEEHQTWYFLWPTLGFTVLYQLLGETYLQSKYPSLKNRKTLEQQMYHMALHWTIILISHRILQSWNFTGAQWALPAEIYHSDYKNVVSSMILILGLSGIFWRCYCQSIENKLLQSEKMLDMCIYFSAAASIYCYHCAVGNVLLPFSYPKSRGVQEVRVFWCTMILLIIKLCGSALYARKYHKEWNGWHAVISSWLLLSSLTQRPHNVILLWVQVEISECLSTLNRHCTKEEIQPYWLAVAHTWLGNIFYFYQGKSNSLATIDVATGYVGQEDYNIFSVGMLLIINTYSAPVLSHLLLVSACAGQSKSFSSPRLFKENLWKAFHCEVCLRMLPMALYASLMIALRYHLFVWSVFSPKLLYESMHTLMLAVLLILTKLVLLLFCNSQSVNLTEHWDDCQE